MNHNETTWGAFWGASGKLFAWIIGISLAFFSAVLGTKLFPPTDQHDVAKRIATSVYFSFFGGLSLGWYIFKYHQDIVKSAEDFATALTLEPIFGLLFIIFACISITGLSGWWVVIFIANQVAKRAERTGDFITDLAVGKASDII